jgi:hypothetical protein
MKKRRPEPTDGQEYHSHLSGAGNVPESRSDNFPNPPP